MREQTCERLKAALTIAAALVVVLTAGCASRKAHHAEADSAEQTSVAPADRDVAEEFAPAIGQVPPAPSVNVFGELDGVERTGVKLVGKAGFQQHTFAAEGYDSDVGIDPTGRWLVFASTRHSQHADLYLQRVGGQSVTQLTSDSAEDAFPCFSPDGGRVAFCSTRAGSWDVYVMDADGRNVIQVTSGLMQDIHPSFSPDGNRLVYGSIGSRSDQWELWTVDLTTHERKMIGFGLFPEWSPDKERDRIAFQRARQRGSRWFSVWTLELVDGEARRMTEVAVSTNAALVAPSWSPDGKRLAFASIVEPAQMTDGEPKGQQDVWVVDADGGNRQRVTDGNGTNLSPHWAADNRIYFISDRGGAECVWSALAQGAGTATAATNDQDQSIGSADVGPIGH